MEERSTDGGGTPTTDHVSWRRGPLRHKTQTNRIFPPRPEGSHPGGRERLCREGGVSSRDKRLIEWIQISVFLEEVWIATGEEEREEARQ